MPPISRLAVLSEKVIEAGWIATAVLAPLFFNPYSSRVFEPDKVALVRSLVLVMAAAWLLRWTENLTRSPASPPPLNGRLLPLTLAVAIVVASVLLSTALSVQPGVSFFGSYARSHGAYTTLCSVILFALMVDCLRERAQLERLVDAMLLTSLPIALYGIAQHQGADPLAWEQGFGRRVFSSLGNPLFLSAFLAMVSFPTLQRCLTAFDRWRERSSRIRGIGALLAYGLLAGLQLAALSFADSRGPVIGWLVALVVFVLARLLALRETVPAGGELARATELSVADLGRAMLLATLALAIASTVYLLAFRGMGAGGVGRISLAVLLLPLAGLAPVVLFASWRPSAVRWAWAAIPAGLLLIGLMFSSLNIAVHSGYAPTGLQARMAEATGLFDARSRSAKARMLIWAGSLKLVEPHSPLTWPDGHKDQLNWLRPVVGYGPETLFLVFNRFYAPDIAVLDSRNAMPDRAHNGVFDSLVDTGVTGAVAQQILFIAVFQLGLSLLGWIPGRRASAASLVAMLLGGTAGIAAIVAVRGWSFLGFGWTAGLVGGVLAYAAGFALFRFGISLRAYLLASSLALLALAGIAFSMMPSAISYVSLLAISALLAVLAYLAGPWLFGTTPGTHRTSEEDRPLVAALFCGVMVHYLEIGLTGISTISTSTYFWVFVALLAVLAWRSALALEASASAAAPGTASDPSQAGMRLPDGTGPVVAMALITSLVMACALFVFVNNQHALTGGPGFEQFQSRLGLASDTLTRLPSQGVRHSLSTMFIILSTWIAGAGFCLVQLRRIALPASRSPLDACLLFAASSLMAVLAYGCLHATVLLEVGRLAQQAWQLSIGAAGRGLAPLVALANLAALLPVVFAASVLALVVGIAISLGPRWRGSRLPIATLPGLMVLAGLLPLLYVGIVRGNLDGIRANTVFRQAAGLPATDAWDAVLLNQARAIELQPAEDRYYAWMGDAYLQKAAMLSASRASPGPGVWLPLQPDAEFLRSLDRERALRCAQAALETALELSPLDPDHSANLSRMHTFWAWHAPSVQAGREHLRLADKNYRVATRLSPNRAQFWNEWAVVHMDRYRLDTGSGDRSRLAAELATARDLLAHSLALDRRYDRSYVVAAELAMLRGRPGVAAANYRKALDLTPSMADAWRGLVEIHRTNPVAARLESTALGHLRKRPKLIPALRVMVAEIYLPADRLADAVAAQRRVVSLTKSQPALSYEALSLAVLLTDAGSPTEALTAAQFSLEGLPPERKVEAESLIALLQRALGNSSTR